MASIIEPKGYLKYAELSGSKLHYIENLRCIQWLGSVFPSWVFSNYFPEPGSVQALNSQSRYPTNQHPFQGKATVIGENGPKKEDTFNEIKMDGI